MSRCPVPHYCKCGCGLNAPKYFDKTGRFINYLVYIKGHRHHQPATSRQLANLEFGRKKNWNNPEYRSKMSRISSQTIRRTNQRRANGEFPEWDRKASEAMTKMVKEMWRDGTLNTGTRRRADGFRSGLERKFADLLNVRGLSFDYEKRSFQIGLQTGKNATYTPDFYLPALDWYIEVKGYWRDDARSRCEAFLEQYPQLSFSVVGPKFETLMGKPW